MGFLDKYGQSGLSGVAVGNAAQQGLAAYLAMVQSGRGDMQQTMQMMMLKNQLDEAARKKQAGADIAGMMQPQFQSYVNPQDTNANEGGTPYTQGTQGATLNPLGQGLLAQKMAGIPQQVPASQSFNEGSVPYQMDTGQQDNPAYAAALARYTTDLINQGGEMKTPKLDMDKFIAAVAIHDPEKAATLKVSMLKNEELIKQKEEVQNIKTDAYRDIQSAKTQAQISTALSNMQNRLDLQDKKGQQAITNINLKGGWGAYDKGGGKTSEMDKQYTDYLDRLPPEEQPMSRSAFDVLQTQLKATAKQKKSIFSPQGGTPGGKKATFNSTTGQLEYN